jgi:hypothetical protein
MDCQVRCRHRDLRQMPDHHLSADLCWAVIIVWLLVWFVPPWMVADVMPSGAGESKLEAERQSVSQAHPEWPSEVRGAVAAGVICAGMSPEMVWAAWGSPTYISRQEVQEQVETWHYAGRQPAVERLGRQDVDTTQTEEWTVFFMSGQVVWWTD